MYAVCSLRVHQGFPSRWEYSYSVTEREEKISNEAETQRELPKANAEALGLTVYNTTLNVLFLYTTVSFLSSSPVVREH